MRRQWWLKVRIIQRAFDDGVVPEEVEWETMVSLPKREGLLSRDRDCGGGL